MKPPKSNISAEREINKLRRKVAGYVKTMTYIHLKSCGDDTITTISRAEYEQWLEDTDKLFFIKSHPNNPYVAVGSVPLTPSEYWTQLPPYIICDHLNEYKQLFVVQVLGEDAKPWIEEIDFVDVNNDNIPF